jgi:hypothetical protein
VTHVGVDSIDQRLGSADKPEPHARRKDFGKAIEPQHAAYPYHLQLESKVGRWPRLGAVVHVVIRVIWYVKYESDSWKRGWGGLPSRMMRSCVSAIDRTSRRRSSVVVIPVGLHPYYQSLGERFKKKRKANLVNKIREGDRSYGNSVEHSRFRRAIRP